MSKGSMNKNRTSKSNRNNVKSKTNNGNINKKVSNKKVVNKNTNNKSLNKNRNISNEITIKNNTKASNKNNVRKVEKTINRDTKARQNVKFSSKEANKNIRKKDIVEKRLPKDNNIRKFPVQNMPGKVVKHKVVNKKVRVLILFSFVIIGIIICSLYLVFNLSIFDLKSIKVTGNSKYTSSQIIDKSSFNTNENIFIQYFKYKDLPLELPYISNVNVKMVFPDEINLEVVERSSKYVAYNEEKDKFYRLDSEGYILEETTQDKKQKDEMLVYNITFNNKVILGDRINEIDLDKLKVFEKIREEYKRIDINGNITKVDFENSLTTITLNDKLNVIFPNDTNLKYNMDLLNSILKKNGDMQGVIDMTKQAPVFSIF